MKPLALVAALVLALLGLAGPATAEDPAPVVTWPEVTAFNPETTTYTITVDDPAGTGTLFADWRGVRQEIPHQGEVTLTFPTDGAARLRILRCDVGPCSDTGVTSGWLSVYRQIDARVLHNQSYASSPGEMKEILKLTPATPADTLMLTWRIFPEADEVPSASGSVEVSPGDDTGRTVVSVPVIGGLAEGTYRMELEASGTLADYGALSSPVLQHTFIVDTTAPVAELSTHWPAFYPSLKDDYLNYEQFDFKTDEPVRGSVEVRNAASQVVSTLTEPGFFRTKVFRWGGRENHGLLLPEGRYTARIDLTDRAGNVETVRAQPFQLSWDEKHRATWRHTFPAASTVLDRFVGSCSTLAKPSSHGWAGSLGYYSATRCSKPKQSVVSTINGVYLPTSLDGRYSNFEISLFGGAARGQGRAYLVMGTLRRSDNAFLQRTVMTGELTSHSGSYFLRPDPILRTDKHGRPYVYWEVGLTQGSRYDVKSFTVEIEYTALD
jgi:hypothetical protein